MPKHQNRSKNYKLVIVATTIGALITVSVEVIFSVSLNRSFDNRELPILLIRSLLVAVPFLLLARRASRRPLSWLLGLIPTVWLQWWWLQKGITYQTAPDGSGVDMVGALIMLVAPFAIAGVCLIFDMLLAYREGRSA